MTGAAPLRRVELDADDLADALRGGELPYGDAVPADARLRDKGYDPREGTFYLTFESRQWTLVPEGHDIPTLGE